MDKVEKFVFFFRQDKPVRLYVLVYIISPTWNSTAIEIRFLVQQEAL